MAFVLISLEKRKHEKPENIKVIYTSTPREAIETIQKQVEKPKPPRKQIQPPRTREEIGEKQKPKTKEEHKIKHVTGLVSIRSDIHLVSKNGLWGHIWVKNTSGKLLHARLKLYQCQGNKCWEIGGCYSTFYGSCVNGYDADIVPGATATITYNGYVKEVPSDIVLKGEIVELNNPVDREPVAIEEVNYKIMHYTPEKGEEVVRERYHRMGVKLLEYKFQPIYIANYHSVTVKGEATVEGDGIVKFYAVSKKFWPGATSLIGECFVAYGHKRHCVFNYPGTLYGTTYPHGEDVIEVYAKAIDRYGKLLWRKTLGTYRLKW